MIALSLVFLFLGGLLIYSRRSKDITVPTPAKLRTDLYYGYYGCDQGQALEVRGHTNLHWESQFNGMAQAATDIYTMGCATVLDVMPQLFEKVAQSGRNYALKVGAADELRALFSYLRIRGALHYVKGIVPIDEPNTNCRSASELAAACDIIRRVADEFPELLGFRLGVIYAASPEPFDCIQLFDVVGVNDYEEKSSILTGVYQRLLAAKRPDARTILLPGGAFGQDPTPFVNWAHSDEAVIAIVPFVWFGPREPRDTWVGIRDHVLRSKYEETGRALIAN